MTRNRQGNDAGSDYRSAIFYTSDEQKRIAEDTIANVDASGQWSGKVATEVVPAGDFWEAEPEHQDYLQRNPSGYTCHFVRPNWKLPVRTGKAMNYFVRRTLDRSAQRPSWRALADVAELEREARVYNGCDGRPRGERVRRGVAPRQTSALLSPRRLVTAVAG